MKLNEFKAWFEGFTESMEDAPSKKQWERIKEQVAAVDGAAITHTTYPIYIDRYVRPHLPPYQPYWVGGGVGVSSAVANLTGAASMQVSNCIDGVATSIPFDSATAMFAAGKAEATAMAS